MLKIITDSAADLSGEYIGEHNPHVIPTPVVIDGVDYLDGDTIQTGILLFTCAFPQVSPAPGLVSSRAHWRRR